MGHDWADALRKSLLFYRAQRSGDLRSTNNPIPWREVPAFLTDGADVGVDLSGGYFDRIAQRQPGKENTFSLSNGRGASFAAAAEPLASAEYLVCLSLDGGDKRSARIHLAAPLSLSELRAALGGSAIRWSDDVFVAPSDGSVRARRVERLGALILSQEPLPTRGHATAPKSAPGALV